MRTALLALVAAALAGCSTLRNAGIGGELELNCKWRTGEAWASDPVAGKQDSPARLVVERRLRDVDFACTELLKAKTAAEVYRETNRREAEAVQELLAPPASAPSGGGL